MKTENKTFSGHLKSWDDKELILEHFISTESQDSCGDVMVAEGMKMRGKPVVLFQHGLDPKFGNEPIAKVLGIRVGEHDGKKGLIARTQYFNTSKIDPNDHTGERLYTKAKDGTMPNWSIGFNSIKERPIHGGRSVDEWELHEYSQVAVGMNSDAHTLSAEVPELKFLIVKEAITVPVVVPSDTLDAALAATAVLETKAAKPAYKTAHKAVDIFHREMIVDMKEHAGKDSFITDGAEKGAVEALEDFGDNALHHVEKYIKAVRDMADGDAFGDEQQPSDADGEQDGADGETEKKSYRKTAAVLRACKSDMVKAIRGQKGKKETVPTEAAKACVKAHAEAALPHAIQFVKEWYEKIQADKAKPELKPAVSDPADGEEKSRLIITTLPEQRITVKKFEPESAPMVMIKKNEQKTPVITRDLVKEMIADATANMAKTINAELRKLAGKVTN